MHGGPHIPCLHVIFGHMYSWFSLDLCALGCGSGTLMMSGAEGNDAVHVDGGTQTSTLSTEDRTSKKSDGFRSGCCKEKTKLIGGESDSVQ